MSTYLTHAVPLRIFTLPKDTVLVNLFTRERGKVSGILRSGKKIKGKLPNYFNLLSELEVMIAPGKNFDIIAGVDRKKIFFDLHTNINKRLLALTMFDVVNQVSNEHEADQGLYEFLLDWLEVLNGRHIENEDLFLTSSLWALLSKIGFNPNIDSCVQCHNDLDLPQLLYRADSGGFVCPKCASDRVEKISVSSTVKLKDLAKLKKGEPDSLLNNFAASDKKLALVLLHHVETILEFEVKGWRVYNEVKCKV